MQDADHYGRPKLGITGIDDVTDELEPAEPTALAPDDNTDPRYLPLMQVLADAYGQAASGKGNDRHAAGKPFVEQPILEIVRMQDGIDGHTYQVMKKAQEAGRMVRRGQHQAAVAELYGIINYAAAAVIRVREIETENGPRPD